MTSEHRNKIINAVMMTRSYAFIVGCNAPIIIIARTDSVIPLHACPHACPIESEMIATGTVPVFIPVNTPE